MRVWISGKYWQLKFVPKITHGRDRAKCDGMCIPATKEIWLLSSLRGFELLHAAAHEGFHVHGYVFDEPIVDFATEHIALLLFRKGKLPGYRKARAEILRVLEFPGFGFRKEFISQMAYDIVSIVYHPAVKERL